MRDTVTVLVLLFSAVVLYAVTSFLFRSFSARRAELGRQFAADGQRELGRGDAEQAIHDLRISLDYAPEQTNNRLLLAEALAQAHHPDQARSYFLTLLDTQPADGFLNLQMARLARQKKNDTQEALDYYRAAAGGNWNGDSRDERFRVQLELADYLIQLHDLPSARAELLIAAADAPQEAAVASMLAEKFQQANDASDALNSYRTAMKLDPKDASDAFQAGRLAFQLGEYTDAARMLSIARRNTAAVGEEGADELDNLLESSRRIQELALSADLGPHERAEHILRALPIANARFEDCSAQVGGGQTPQQLQGLEGGWKEAYKVRQRRSMLDDAAEQDGLVKLIFDTEISTARLCGQPSGDDALLLQLANSARGAR